MSVMAINAALLKDRARFFKSATDHFSTTFRPKAESLKRKAVSSPSSAQNKLTKIGFDYKTSTGGSRFKFGVLAKIVNHMKGRFQDGVNDPLSLSEIIEETTQLNVSDSDKNWLEKEALPNNPKIAIVDYKFCYKPKYESIKDRRTLLRLLERHHRKGRGGILFEDVGECLPNAEKILKGLKDFVILVPRGLKDKRPVVFYNDKSIQLEIDENLGKLWNSVSVEDTNEKNIANYLDKHGIRSMQDVITKTAPKPTQKRRAVRKRVIKKQLNEHIADVLEDYSQQR